MSEESVGATNHTLYPTATIFMVAGFMSVIVGVGFAGDPGTSGFEVAIPVGGTVFVLGLAIASVQWGLNHHAI